MKTFPDVNQTQLEAVCQLSGFNFSQALAQPLTQRVVERVAQLKLPNVQAYVDRLQDNSFLDAERPFLGEVLSTRETFFMRDAGQLSLLSEAILPELLQKHGLEHEFRIWSSACSTGEEIYSLAILLRDFARKHPGFKYSLLASDIDVAALALARQGVYRAWSFRGCSEEFKNTYFTQQAGGWQIKEAWKQGIRFEQIDLLAEDFPDVQKGIFHFDVIVCRNLFIYLTHASINALVNKLVNCLFEGGYLLCAPGELHAYAHPQLISRVFTSGIVHQKSSRSSAELSNLSQTPVTMSVPVPPVTRLPVSTMEAAVASNTLDGAWRLANAGNIDEALAVCDTLKETSPFDPQVHYLIGVILLAKGDAAQCREALRKVLYLNHCYIPAYPMLIDLCLSSNDTAAAKRYCQQAMDCLKVLPGDQLIVGMNGVSVQDLFGYLQNLLGTLR